MLAYTTLLSILTFVQRKEDPTIWHCCVREIHWQKFMQTVKSTPNTPTLPAFRSKTPVIYAPKPKRLIPPLLSSCSARNSAAFDIEPTQIEDPVVVQWPLAPARAMTQKSPIGDPFFPTPPSQPSAMSFYNSSVQKELRTESGPRRPAPPPPLDLSLPSRTTASPPLLGDWPRLDATTRPRIKRYPRYVPPAPDMPEPLFSNPTRPRIQPSPHTSRPHTTPVPVDVLITTRPLQILPRQGRSPGRDHSASPLASVPRNPPVDRRPPPLDLSNITVHRARQS